MASINPHDILYTIPTIASDLPPLVDVAPDEVEGAFRFHEDDWSQLEFHPIERLEEIRAMMREYAAFEKANRVGEYWGKLYIRKLERQPVLGEEIVLAHLLEVVEGVAGDAPILHTSSAIVGRVANGFTIDLGGNITFYGYEDATGIPVLGAVIDDDPDDGTLFNAFVALHETFDVIFVDWSTQTILVGIDEETGGLVVWEP
jgi:hypothetical protein